MVAVVMVVAVMVGTTIKSEDVLLGANTVNFKLFIIFILINISY